MFSLIWFYQIHVYLIALGVIIMCTSVYIIMFKKNKPWRIKRHRLLSFISADLILLGILLMYLGKESVGLLHFTVPHALGGLVGAILLVVTPLVALIGMKNKPKLIGIHRWLGRITAVVVLFVTVFGILLLMSYLS